MITPTQVNYAILAAALAGIITVVFFNIYPSLDLEIAGFFALGERRFTFTEIPAVHVLRSATMAIYGGWYLMICIALAVAYRKRIIVLGLAARDWLYVVLCSFIGPGIFANLLLKEYSGRARPRNVEEFGGSFEFSPVLNWSEQCSSNCSFISGEVSSMFMIFAPLAFVAPKKRGFLVFAMFLFGGLSGLLRVGQGAHFTSDCIMAGIIMILTAALLHKLVYPQQAPYTQENEA